MLSQGFLVEDVVGFGYLCYVMPCDGGELDAKKCEVEFTQYVWQSTMLFDAV